MDNKEYLDQSSRTAAEISEENRVIDADTIGAVLVSGITGNLADCTKRRIFYKDPNTEARFEAKAKEHAALGDRLDALNQTTFQMSQSQMDILHAILGIQSELGEIVEEFLNSIVEGRELDLVNMREEAGDQLWYLALFLRAIGGTFDDSMARNIAKLFKRFPEKFTTTDALNRDLVSERRVLEDNDVYIPDEGEIVYTERDE